MDNRNIGFLLFVASIIVIMNGIAIQYTIDNQNIELDSLGQDVNVADANVLVEESENGIKTTIIRNENVEEFKVYGPNNSTYLEPDVGESVEINDGEGQYIVVGITSNSESVMLVYEYNEYDSYFL